LKNDRSQRIRAQATRIGCGFFSTGDTVDKTSVICLMRTLAAAWLPHQAVWMFDVRTAVITAIIIETMSVAPCPAKDMMVIARDDSAVTGRISLFEKIAGKNLLDSIKSCLKTNHLDHAKDLIRRADQDTQYSRVTPRLKADIFYRTNRLDSAVCYLQKTLKLNQGSEDTSLIQNLNAFLGLIHFEMKDYGKAADYFRQGKTEDRYWSDFLSAFERKKPYEIRYGLKNGPIRFEALDPFPKIGVAVNGKGSRHFIFDTGCNLTVISRSMARRCGVKPFVTIHPHTREKSKNYQVDIADRTFAMLDSLNLGNHTICNVPVLILDDKKMSFRILGITLYRLDGAVGLPIMKQFKVTVDYPRKEILLESPGEGNRATHAQKMFLFQNQAFVYVGINQISDFNFFIDSGTPRSTMTRNALAFLDSSQVDMAKPRDGAIKHVDIKLKVLGDWYPKNIGLCGISISHFPFAVVERNSEVERNVVEHGVLAQDFLRNFIVRYDFPNMEFELIKPEDRSTGK
jgi:hypothetical protein